MKILNPVPWTHNLRPVFRELELLQVKFGLRQPHSPPAGGQEKEEMGAQLQEAAQSPREEGSRRTGPGRRSLLSSPAPLCPSLLCQTSAGLPLQDSTPSPHSWEAQPS